MTPRMPASTAVPVGDRRGIIHLAAVGTHGDVLPVLALAAALARRGRAVRVAEPVPYAAMARRAGLPFHPLGDQADFDRFVDAPDAWHPRRSVHPLFDYVNALNAPTYRWLAENCDPATDLVVASTVALGARTAQEALGFRLVSLHVMPFLLESRHAPPRLPGLPLPRALPAACRAAVNRFADRHFLEPAVLPDLNAFRARLRLPPVRHLRRWWHSPDRVLLGFPGWYAPPQLDWPAQAVQVPFLLSDDHGDVQDLPQEIAAFLDRGPPPLVFTYGSAMRQAGAFFATAVAICRSMGRRGILLAPQEGQVPSLLPDGVIHAHYVPLSCLLPRAAALVHHGGVGTVAQAMAAGVPQLIIPVAFDHVDEGIKITGLGVGAMLKQKHHTPEGGASTLAALLASEAVASACERVRARMRAEDGLRDACVLVERTLPSCFALEPAAAVA